jgi:uncharacterized protein (TIGR01777 family)
MQRFLISGATGLVGSELSAVLTAGGHTVVALTRRRQNPNDIEWSPEKGQIESQRLSSFDAVVHLAGESVMGRWSTEKKRRIRESRVIGTRLVSETLANLPQKPRVLVCASAIGYYGDRGDELLTEESPPGKGFLADVCQEWEAACEPARQAGIRVVNVRIGLVLTPKGGLLGTLLPLFKVGLGGRVGDGRQWMSWLTLEDLVEILKIAAFDEALVGPVNATAPNPVTNADFTHLLGRLLGRPTLLPVPRFAVKSALGEAADELALASARVVPARLQQHGYSFRHPELEPALRALLTR